MGDQGFTIGAGTAAISAAVRYFGEQVVVGISTLADGSTPNDIPAPKKHSLKVGGTTAMKPSHHLVITAVKIKNPTANSNGKSANGKSVNGKNGLKVKNKAKLATNGKRK